MSLVKERYSSKKPYLASLSRRDAIKWIGALSVTAAFPGLTACSSQALAPQSQLAKGHWPQLDLPVINATGYGKDPNLIIAPRASWPRTLTAAQLTFIAVLADIVAPREGAAPSASEVKVPDLLDEWVSAPYEQQQQDRVSFLHLLAWLDEEARRRFDNLFVDVRASQQLAIIDDIAYKKAMQSEEFVRSAKAFADFRRLVLACFFCSPAGVKDIGYLGNVPIVGDYPGPSDEAMTHLQSVLDELGLTL
ncbi:gluconate 2-dehydrogenase subunit 3 family protein [Shewanella nanhaiensis]|uniref:Gluconate 2-dehydrogenase subunit 3 family protein n=1 Tax=Shewanella nanhaiensis TaxID=2864872 RepID=A0ABS7E4A7_9GAMM|nr:gluconate 2-dehydrogenase subunit 3 family protein [Shewanella nanhaiensis]MBW8184521.1 gluconate 2-dehydrogenase subunit 3 family protein [Shewanella nanhaiensis]